jgi:hypothetical protein
LELRHACGKTVLKSVQDAQRVLGEYIAPGARNPEMAINELLTILDDRKLVNAVWKLDPMSKPDKVKNDCPRKSHWIGPARAFHTVVTTPRRGSRAQDHRMRTDGR